MTQEICKIDKILIDFERCIANYEPRFNAPFIPNDISKNKECSGESNVIPYIEKLLSLRIADHRKFVIPLILAPYFVNIQHLSNTDAFHRIKQWTLKCNERRKLEPSVEYFDRVIRTAIKRCILDPKIKPLRLKSTLRYKNSALYDLLR